MREYPKFVKVHQDLRKYELMKQLKILSDFGSQTVQTFYLETNTSYIGLLLIRNIFGYVTKYSLRIAVNSSGSQPFSTRAPPSRQKKTHAPPM